MEARIGASGIDFCNHSGMSASGTRTVAAGTSALRRYFWARMSEAICDQKLGTFRVMAVDPFEPSMFFNWLVRVSNSMPSNGVPSPCVNMRENFIMPLAV